MIDGFMILIGLFLVGVLELIWWVLRTIKAIIVISTFGFFHLMDFMSQKIGQHKQIASAIGGIGILVLIGLAALLFG